MKSDENSRKDIVGTKGDELKGRRIAHCVTGSVSAIKAPEIARELMRRGAEVYAVLSKDTLKVITGNIMEWATGNPVVTKLTGKVEHVELAGKWGGAVDLVLIAPATANTLSKIALGIDDTPVTSVASVALGSKIPIVVAPAMHEPMYENPIVVENIEKLKAMGIVTIGPLFEEGRAKLASTEEIVATVTQALSKRDLEGVKMLVTAGPTREPIDPVRTISNRSTGKMGLALAEEGARRGAQVTLIYGPSTLKPPSGVKVMRIETTKDLYDATCRELKTQHYDIYVAAAAPADFTPEKMFDSKVSTSSSKTLELKLKATEKVVNVVKQLSPQTFLAAFKVEHGQSEDEHAKKAQALIETSGADLVIVNDSARDGVAFGTETNEVLLVGKNGLRKSISKAPKRQVAAKILDVVVKERKM